MTTNTIQYNTITVPLFIVSTISVETDLFSGTNLCNMPGWRSSNFDSKLLFFTGIARPTYLWNREKRDPSFREHFSSLDPSIYSVSNFSVFWKCNHNNAHAPSQASSTSKYPVGTTSYRNPCTTTVRYGVACHALDARALKVFKLASHVLLSLESCPARHGRMHDEVMYAMHEVLKARST